MKKKIYLLFLLLLLTISLYPQSKKKWENTKALNTIEGYQEFIQKYPNGEFTTIAKQELVKLQEIQNQELKKLQEIQNKKIAEANLVVKKIIPGTQLEDVLRIIDYDKMINRNIGIKKGAYIGTFDIFPQDLTKESDFSGIAEMKGYEIIFKKGKVVSAKINQEKLGTKNCKFSNEDGIHTMYCNPEMLMGLPDLK
jgi:Skp family chaperone for outer membrane proteins